MIADPHSLWQREATVRVQSVMVLRWFKEVTDLKLLAREAGVSVPTVYRYFHEGINIIAASQSLSCAQVKAST